MTSLEHLARAIARAKHGTDAMWANYMGAAEAVEKMMSGWQPIEVAPKDGTHVLLFFPNGYWADDRNISVGFWGAGDDWFDSEASSGSMTAFGSHPTHWMKLPEPPK